MIFTTRPFRCAHEQKHMACMRYASIGTVDRCGYDGQQKTLFVTLVDHIPQFEAY